MHKKEARADQQSESLEGNVQTCKACPTFSEVDVQTAWPSWTKKEAKVGAKMDATAPPAALS